MFPVITDVVYCWNRNNWCHMHKIDSLVFHLIVSWYLFFSPVRLIASTGQRREGMEFQWSRQVATFPCDIFKHGWREKELKASLEAPLKPSNLVWNRCVRALWSANGQAAAMQPAISPHYRWEPHSQHCAQPFHLTTVWFAHWTDLPTNKLCALPRITSLYLPSHMPCSITPPLCMHPAALSTSGDKQ